MEWSKNRHPWVWICLCFWCASPTRADTSAAPSPGLVLIEQNYDAAKTRYQAHPADPDAAWQFARACFDQADWSTKDSQREAAANEGIAACNQALQLKPNLAPAFYYLGMNQAQLAQTKMLGALPLVKAMAKSWEQARQLDEHFDFAGADRNLGLLYRNAPSPPFSIGNRIQAEQHALRAVELAPNYPENYLNLIESQIKWRQWPAAVAEDDKLLALLPAARREFSGLYWQSSWDDWDRRQQEIETKLRPWRSAPP